MAKRSSTKATAAKEVVTLTHEEATRRNIPTAEFESVMKREQQAPLKVKYPRNTDLDPQLVWRGKDEQDWSDLVVPAPPLFIQEKVHPKALIDDLRHQSEAATIAKKLASGVAGGLGDQIDLFADFNGLPDTDARTEFYQHDQHWANRLILGDSLQVMASLAEREGLRGKVQCIYLDPPYGIKFNSNFQWSTTSKDVKDGNIGHMTREPEQVKAFRDTWRDGIHSYLSYLRDRLTVIRDLLTESGSVFIQIGDENIHRIRILLDEVFGESNFVGQIAFAKTTATSATLIPTNSDFIIWYAKRKESVKYRQMYGDKSNTLASYNIAEDRATGEWRKMSKNEQANWSTLDQKMSIVSAQNLRSQGVRTNTTGTFEYQGRKFFSGNNHNWKTTFDGVYRLIKANRLILTGSLPNYKRYLDDYPVVPITNQWDDTAIAGFSGEDKVYVVQTATRVIERCILMTTDPGDLVLDPTCGSGTTAYVAEQWGRRWITIDTSRVALALARARIMGARYPYYLKADSREGQAKEAEVTRTAASTAPVQNSLRQGFVYERVPHITLKSIANNAEIDVIWEKFQARLEPLREALNTSLEKAWQEWEISRSADDAWLAAAKTAHADWWQQRIQRQKEIDASIAARAEFEFLYDKPYEDKKKVRVAGPFTVESLSPHRTLAVGADDELIDPAQTKAKCDEQPDFAAMIMEHLKTAGVQQADKGDKISFTSIAGWPGLYICAEGRYADGDGAEKRAGIFIGPEFGTVSRQDLVTAAREAGDANFDVLIACAFNYEAHASEFNKLGRIPVLKARMNAELHMGTELKNTGKGNLFVIFGEPDIDVLPPEDAPAGAAVKDFDLIRVKINGVDVFHPQSGEVRSDGAEGIACWFIDTDYNEESFFVRQAYFLGANDPYKSLKTTLKAEINEEAWSTLNSDTSRAFVKPAGGKIAVKVINHLGDEVMKVFRVE